MSNVLEKILLRIKAVAPVTSDLVVPGSGSLVEGLMRGITGDGPDTPIETVAHKIAGDSAYTALLLVQAMKQEVRLAQMETARQASVNRTRQNTEE